MTGPILSLRNLTKVFETDGGPVRAVESVSFDVAAGECFAIVGESGSGKSTIANMILGIYPQTGGEILFEGAPLPRHRLLEHRRAIQLVQQNPLSSLNPRRSIAASLRLALDVHAIGTPADRPRQMSALLAEVGLPESHLNRLPAGLSGGERQRVAIARALACSSRVVVLDEPTSALDVLVQARVLRLLADLRAKRGLTYVFITHDLAIVRNIATRVAVFEKGRLLEIAETERLFANPVHPYTRRLIAAVPVVTEAEATLRDQLKETAND